MKDQNSSAILTGLVAAALLVSSVNLIVSMKENKFSRMRPPIEQGMMYKAPVAPSAPTPTQVPATHTLETKAVDLSYPDGWHVFVVEDAEGADGGSTKISLNNGPIVASYPSDAPTSYEVIIQTIAEDAAIYAGYEEADWRKFDTADITVNGQRATQFLLEAGPDMEYVPEFQEVLFISGPTKRVEVSYVYGSPAEINDPAWQLIKNSLKVK